MKLNIFPAVGGLFQFFQRYGIGTVEEIIEIIGGFTTSTTGVYNPIYSKPKKKPKKIKIDPYTKKDFEFYYKEPLNIISTKDRSRKFRLPIGKPAESKLKTGIPVLHEMESKGFTTINVIKSCLDKIKSIKLNILGEIRGYDVNPLTIKTWLKQSECTPLVVEIWLRKALTAKLGVLTLVDCYDTTRISDSTYILDDVGNISEIEMIEMIGDINAIRH